MSESALRQQFSSALAETGMVAILRGITPEQAPGVGAVLYEAGFRLIEVPLNSPEPLRSIERLAAHLPADVLLGAGTVMQVSQVREVQSAGGQLIVMPHADVQVIRAAAEAGMVALPGVATPTEAFAALAAGAAALKAFPAEALPPVVIKAWRAVVPKSVPVLPVGGVTPDSMAAYLAAGASGFGLGGALYRAGDDAQAVAPRAAAFMQRWRECRAQA